jgi:hypothetical protein
VDQFIEINRVGDEEVHPHVGPYLYMKSIRYN